MSEEIIYPGRLIKPTEMALHTLQAQKLFTGRKKTEVVKGIPGVMTFANVCYQLWMLTEKDNPYADMLLIQITEEIEKIDKEISTAVKHLRSKLEERKSRGLMHEIAVSAKPLVIGDISFGSPYGYKACDLLVNFDYYIRVASTLEEVGQIKTADSKAAKEAMWHRVRTFVYKTVRQADILRKEKLLPMSRADFDPDADDEAKIRVALVAETLGELPADILSGKRKPDFYKPARAPAGKPASKRSAPV
ncbi:MAG: TIGR03761 family integrating conjugative element protein [Sulfuricellaceae bacterium]